jgi:hypothetical protein
MEYVVVRGASIKNIDYKPKKTSNDKASTNKGVLPLHFKPTKNQDQL